VREFGREHGLADATDDACFKHGAYALDHGFERHSRLVCDHMKWMALETSDEIFGNGEDFRVDGI
jgi:hypothetical protein